MATHSSIPVWRITWPEQPDGLQSMGSQRVGHDCPVGLESPAKSWTVTREPDS